MTVSLMPDEKRKPSLKVSVYLDEDLKQDVEALAASKGLSISSLIKTLLTSAVRTAKKDGDL